MKKCISGVHGETLDVVRITQGRYVCEEPAGANWRYDTRSGFDSRRDTPFFNKVYGHQLGLSLTIFLKDAHHFMGGIMKREAVEDILIWGFVIFICVIAVLLNRGVI